MYSFVNNVQTKAKSNQRYLLDRIANTKLFIGVAAEPDFVEEDGHFDCIWDVAEDLDAVVFAANAMLTNSGQRILSFDGEFDVSL